MEAGCAYTSMLHGMLHPGCWALAVKAKAPRRARRRAAMATLAAQDKNQCRWITKRTCTFLLFWRHTRQNCMRDIFQQQASAGHSLIFSETAPAHMAVYKIARSGCASNRKKEISCSTVPQTSAKDASRWGFHEKVHYFCFQIQKT